MWDSFLTYALTPLIIREILYPKPTREERLIRGYEIRELFCRVRWLKATGLYETSQVIKLHYNEKSRGGF
ncbi:hypothetical protein LCGC14_1393290 [marine sediment metagenome]|uniref:Uncharacterized protein n=1 Tax=marine sediment metagenome TaxID=412755 RepID=A0A0F9JZF2_9ZZZZ